MSIPKIIHYCWFGGSEIPERDKKCIESWKKFCPDYEIIQWNEKNYDVASAPIYVRQAYKAQKWAFVTDYVRMQVVFEHGGIYLDTDVEIVKSLDMLLKEVAYFGCENGGYINTGLGFGAEKGSPILKELCDYYRTLCFAKEDGTLNLLPNPIIVTEYLKKRGYEVTPGVIGQMGEVTIFPEEYFCPQVFSTGKIKITDKTYSIHHYHASWQTEREQKALREYRWYTNLFGEKLGELVYQVHKTLKEKGICSTVRKIIGHWKKKTSV